jgi:hypothetical protein
MGYVMKLLDRLEAEAPCASHAPGHQLHWTHWKQAASSPAIVVTKVRMVGDVVELLLPGDPVRWRHHDAARLQRALRTSRQPIAAVPEHGMLRVDGYWFNCVSADAEFTLCG